MHFNGDVLQYHGNITNNIMLQELSQILVKKYGKSTV